MPCFVPPILLRNIAQRATGELRDWALDTLVDSAYTRGHREGASLIELARVSVKRKGLLRTVYDAANHRTLPGTVARSEGEPAVGDAAVDEAFSGAQKTYDFFFKTLGRRSVDNDGLPLDSTVHYGRRFANAFWNGRQMVYGDGDGHVFGRFTAALEVIAHELTHGVIQYSAGLEFEGEAGALNEHFADVFGVLVRQYSAQQSAREADWTLGHDLLTANVHAQAIRSMSAPGSAYDDPLLGRDEQPSHMRDYVETADDSGGVHLNCGIPNKAFYTLATTLGGNAWDAAGRVWYVTLCNRLRRTATFQECADATYAVAAELYGRNSRVPKAVRAAWKSVGISATMRAPKILLDAASPQLRAVTRPTPIAIGEEAGVRPETFEQT